MQLFHAFAITNTIVLGLTILMAASCRIVHITFKQCLALFAAILPAALHFWVSDLTSLWQAIFWILLVMGLWFLYISAQSWATKLFHEAWLFVLLILLANLASIHALLQNYSLSLIQLPGPIQIFQPPGYGQPYGGPFNQRNLLGLLLLMGIAAAWTRFALGEATIWLLASIFPAAIVLASGGRTSLALLALLVLICIWVSSRRWRFLLGIAACLAMAGLLSFYLSQLGEVVPPSTLERLQAFSQSGGADPRLLIWASCVELWLQHPALGIGPGQIISHFLEGQALALAQWPALTAYTDSVRGGNLWAHNWLLHLLTEQGVLGLCIWLSILGPFFIRAIRHVIQRDSGYVLPSVILLFTAASGLLNVSYGQVYFLTWATLAMGALRANELTERSYRIVQFTGIIFASVIIVLGVRATQIQYNLELNASKPLRSDAFIKTFARGIENPITARPALYWYFVRLWNQRAPSHIWIRSEALARRFWGLYQYDGSLRVNMVVSHLKQDWISEQKWIRLFLAAYPASEASGRLNHHLTRGHENGEPIEP
ncbi:MAG: O-antigen ligase domain-containing protein [Gammaproteobacteria bacterium]|nr:MAG: O-antigen ligase domain-containing protein [Gammaproteobacteria bacterium]